MAWWNKVLVGAMLVGLFENWPMPAQSPKLQSWEESGNYFEFDGHKIFYKADAGTYKQKRVVVICHGFPSFSYDWYKVWDSLLENFSQVIALDFIGFGFSDKPRDHNYTIVYQADIVEALLRKLEVTEVHLLGHDYGDTVVQELLSRYQDRQDSTSKKGLKLKSICVSNGGLFPETHIPRPSQKLLLMPYLGPVFARLTNRFFFKRGFSEVFGKETQPSEEEFSDFWYGLRYKDGYVLGNSLLQYVPQRWANRERWVGALQQTNLPVHMIFGPDDPVNKSPAFEKNFRELLPDASLVVLHSSISHYPQLEDPEGFMESYIRFLKKNIMIMIQMIGNHKFYFRSVVLLC